MPSYPGSFRRTPPSSVLEQTDDGRRLLGGSPTADSENFENRLIESKFFEQGTGYRTLQVIAKLSLWLPIPFHFALVDKGKKSVTNDQIDGNSSSCDDDGRDDYSDELSLSTLTTCDGEAGGILPHNARPLEASLSHVAEAYYAHQATQQVDEFLSNEQHLDYVVTQFDIARMARNASKHLDVESILSLPTLTYHCSTSKDCRDGDEINESWSLVTAPNMDKVTEEVAMESNICVICMEEYVEGDGLRVLPCNHSFHVGCIDRWLSGSHSHLECVTNGCPVCKEKPVAMVDDSAIECDGYVPSWAFTQLGNSLARSLGVP
ncbi:unnamed protein product [Cylindrotheca closterium]|uniref:RING-type domain-containing protein n=1 Tax=Cylindrotheca closterium TaxID=2856 RepID=A0AAD2CFH6_9STRA|nr:unnamed protein product [Cylindrotheca closterium]